MNNFKILLALVLAVTVVASHKRPFRSVKAPKATISNYDVVVPLVLSRSSEKKYPKTMEIVLNAQSYNFTLILAKNEQLISSRFASRLYDENGRASVVKGHQDCYYHGEVKGHPQWMVTMATCEGLQGEFGDPTDNSSYYHLEPLGTVDDSFNRPHALYLSTEHEAKSWKCGNNHTSSNHVADHVYLPGMMVTDHIERIRRQSSNIQHTIELVIVCDRRQYDAFRRNRILTERRAIAVVNGVDNMFRALNIRVCLVDIIIWTSDLISVTSNSDRLLENFNDYDVQRISTRHDAAMLLTGRTLAQGTIGIAYLSTMCSSRESSAVTVDGGEDLLYVQSTCAHEIGHLLNMNHDRRRCRCSDPTGECIMSAYAGEGVPTQWSSCSREELQQGFDRYDLDRCLSPKPTTPPPTPPTTPPTQPPPPPTLPTPLPPVPQDVMSYCSAVVWRIPCQNAITGYDVQFYIPGTVQRRTNHVDGNITFHYAIQDQDKLNNLDETIVRVRAVNSNGNGEWSDGVPLGCQKLCSDGPTTAVYFTHNGVTYGNNSALSIRSIGEGNNALLCVTDRVNCCGYVPNRFGEFYYPNGNRVPTSSAGESFYRNRGDKLIRLNRRNDATSPRGKFRCQLPNQNGVMQNIFITLM